VSEIESAPYWVCPGEPGERVEVTVGIKFGHWAPEPGTFELLVDEIGFYEVETNELLNGGMESEDGWEVIWYNPDSYPEYEFNYIPDELPEFFRGGCLHVMLDDSPNGQLLLYQRVTCVAGDEYRASGAIKIIEYFSNFEPVNQGPWYQFYVTEIEPDPSASDFNPAGTKMFDISAWDAGCDMMDFEQFNGLWEDVCCVSEIATAPYWVCPGTPGEPVEVTVGIKFGHWAPEPGTFELLVDEIMFVPWIEGAATAVNDKTGPVAPADFVLEQNSPNPFNPTTNIGFSLPSTGHATLKVYNVLGELITTLVDGQMSAGRHAVSFDVVDLPSGIYYYTLTQDSHRATKKCVIMK
jgi:hypothetical protein